MGVAPAVQAVMRRANKKYPGSVILGSEIAIPRETITTGVLSFDAALGGGWATNHWVECYGWESSGKTWLALRTIAANQRRDPQFTTLWIATEEFYEPYADMWGVDRSRVVVLNDHHMEFVLQTALEAIETKAVDLVVIDSVPGLVPDRTDENDMSAFQPGLKAIRMAQFFEKCNGALKRSLTDDTERPCTGIAINQMRHKIGGYGDPESTPGGNAKNFWFFQRVKIRRANLLKNTKQLPIGQTSSITVIKNKLAPLRRIAEVDFYFAHGGGFKPGQIDATSDIIRAARTYEVITSDRSHYVFEDQKWYGRPKLEKAIRADSLLRAKIKKATLVAAAEPLPPPKQVPRKRHATR